MKCTHIYITKESTLIQVMKLVLMMLVLSLSFSTASTADLFPLPFDWDRIFPRTHHHLSDPPPAPPHPPCWRPRHWNLWACCCCGSSGKNPHIHFQLLLPHPSFGSPSLHFLIPRSASASLSLKVLIDSFAPAQAQAHLGWTCSAGADLLINADLTPAHTVLHSSPGHLALRVGGLECVDWRQLYRRGSVSGKNVNE